MRIYIYNKVQQLKIPNNPRIDSKQNWGDGHSVCNCVKLT
jgi:hypothetical protein